MNALKRILPVLAALALVAPASASWYWPFGNDGGDSEKKEPRLSELMGPASALIDDASDLAADGKTSEAIEKYRAALAELDKVEAENPDRVARPEFATLRNKRAYVNAAIDSMLLRQIQTNARAVAVSDTTELEKKIAAAAKPVPAAEKTPAAVKTDPSGKTAPAGRTVKSLRKQFLAAMAKRDFASAETTVREMLAENPAGALALNLKAVLEIERGNPEAAEAILSRCITVNPESHYAYYNLCELKLRAGDRAAAKRYYEQGRGRSGPVNPAFEKALKGVSE